MGARLFTAVLITLLGCAAPLWAQPSTDEVAALRALFEAGRREAHANEEALAEAQRLLAESPGDPLLVAYLGSIETVEGRNAWLPWNKLRQVDRGLAHLDRALRAAEQLPEGDHWRAQEVRLVAANTFLALPPMFNTGDRGGRLLDQLMTDPRLGEAPAPLRAAIEQCAAERSSQRASRVEERDE